MVFLFCFCLRSTLRLSFINLSLSAIGLSVLLLSTSIYNQKALFIHKAEGNFIRLKVRPTKVNMASTKHHVCNRDVELHVVLWHRVALYMHASAHCID